MKNFIVKNKKVLIIVGVIAGIIAALTILVALSIMLVKFIINKNKKLTHEEQLTKYLETIGANWYSSWYDDLKAAKKDSTKEYLSKHSSPETCIKIDLENLFRSDPEVKKKYLDEFVNDKTKEKCNMTETKVTICPKDPYEKTDYDIKATLSCGY